MKRRNFLKSLLSVAALPVVALATEPKPQIEKDGSVEGWAKPDQWMHYSFVRSNGQMSFYLDGKEIQLPV